jgi:hypothetical protein
VAVAALLGLAPRAHLVVAHLAVVALAAVEPLEALVRPR